MQGAGKVRERLSSMFQTCSNNQNQMTGFCKCVRLELDKLKFVCSSKDILCRLSTKNS